MIFKFAAKRLLLLSIAIGWAAAVSADNPVPERRVTNMQTEFVIFDATLYEGKPDFSRFGVKNIPIIYAGQLWDPGEDRQRLPREQRVALIARTKLVHSEIAIIDI